MARRPSQIPVAPRRISLTSRLLWILFALFRFSYGTLVLFAFVVRSRLMNRRFRVMDQNDKEQLRAARDRLWNLQKQPLGLKHAFVSLRDHVKLHYVYSRLAKEVKGKTGLVIFIHGFPDSWHIWHNLLKSTTLRNTANLVAVDLPGYGGSDDLDLYNPTHVLEVVAEFVTKMREMYASYDENGQQAPVIIVAHDWGACIGFRLASEAPILADRFILSNSFHVPMMKANVDNRVKFISRMISTWVRNPLNWRPLSKLWPSARPIFNQLGKSGYIFAFNLPWPLPNILGHVGDFWMFRLLNAFGESNNPPQPLSGAQGWDTLAGSIGPGFDELDTKLSSDGNFVDPLDPDEALKYPLSIKSRVHTGGWFEKLKVYRDGLATSAWNKSLQCVWDLNQIEQVYNSVTSTRPATSSSGSSITQTQTHRRRSSSTFRKVGVFDSGPVGSLEAATTVIWGAKDIALNTTLSTEGMLDYFGIRDSHLVLLPSVGHWTPLGKTGASIWEKVIAWAVEGENDILGDALADYPAAKILVTS